MSNSDCADALKKMTMSQNSSIPDPRNDIPSNSNVNTLNMDKQLFNETKGPRVGVKLTISQAELILQRHLNISCIKLEYIDRGYNNRTYIASSSNGQDYIIRLGGRFWNRWKTEREVATILFISKTTSNIPVPVIHGFCSDKLKSEIDCEYILMEKLVGIPLEDMWKSSSSSSTQSTLSIEDKEFILDQIARLLHELQSITFTKIGSLCFTSCIGDTYGLGINPSMDINLEDIIVGQQTDIMAGPFHNYIDYECAAISAAINDMRKCNFMSSSYDLIPKIEKFLSNQFHIDSNIFQQDVQLIQPKIALIHGDFESRNIMIDPSNLTITGIVDWEFAGAFPYYEDWFAGFEFVGAICDEAWTFDEESQSAESNHSSSSDDYDPNSEELTVNRELFFKSLQKHNLSCPDEISHLKLYAEFWYLRWNISPWWFNECAQEENPIEWEKDKLDARRRVEMILEKYSDNN